MKVELWAVGKTADKYLEDGIAVYQKRLKRYFKFEIKVIPSLKNASKWPVSLIKQREGEAVLQRLQNTDFLAILDEKGRQYASVEFAKYIEQQLYAPQRRLVFLVGGAYGFSPEVYARANGQLSLSKMTFSHQMVRLFFVEQLYRAMAILNNEPYHNN